MGQVARLYGLAGILEIQQQIGEVNEIFQDLAVLVNEQGQMIDDIEANIVSTAVRTKAGAVQLGMHFTHSFKPPGFIQHLSL